MTDAVGARIIAAFCGTSCVSWCMDCRVCTGLVQVHMESVAIRPHDDDDDDDDVGWMQLNMGFFFSRVLIAIHSTSEYLGVEVDRQ